MRSLYLVAGEGDIGFQNLLDTLRLILTSSLSDSVFSHIDPIHYFIDDGICFHSSSPSVELHLFHSPGHEVYEVAFERAPYGALKGIHADTKETEAGRLSIVDCGNLSKDVLELTSQSRPEVLHTYPLWREPFPNHIRDHLEKLFRLFGDSEANRSFWREWYQGFLDGKPLDWELQRRVALIDDAVWEAGPAAVAAEIERVRAEFETEQAEAGDAPLRPVPPDAAAAMALRLAANREAIALGAASLLEQVAEFREKVRGNNQLDADIKEQYLAFLDRLSAQLTNLMALLPGPGEEATEAQGEGGVRWLRDFKVALSDEAAQYARPENLAGAAFPTGIILACTGIGTLLGMPVAGAVIGGLVTGQLKPGKAADDLLNPRSPGPD